MYYFQHRNWTKDEIAIALEERSNYSRNINRWVDRCKKLEKDNKRLRLENNELLNKVESIQIILE